MSIAPALQIAAGLVLGSAAKQVLGLRGLGATVAEQCLAAWPIARGLDWGRHTDAERKAASEFLNANCYCANGQCRELTAAEKSLHIRSGSADDLWARQIIAKGSPGSRTYPAAIIAAPHCSPLDAPCVACGAAIAAYNTQAYRDRNNARNRDQCFYDCARRIRAGQGTRSDCNRCLTDFPDLHPPVPACAQRYSANYQSPAPQAPDITANLLPFTPNEPTGQAGAADQQQTPPADHSTPKKADLEPPDASSGGTPPADDSGSEQTPPATDWTNLSTWPWWSYLAAGAIGFALIGGRS